MKPAAMPYRILIFALIWLVLDLFPPPLAASTEAPPSMPPLTLAIFAASTHQLNRFRPLADYLSRDLGRTVKLSASQSLRLHVMRCGRDMVDIAYLSPLAYVMLVKGFPRPRLLAREARHGVPFVFSHIVVRKDSHLVTLNQLAKTDFAFESPDSTMGYAVPRFILARAGVPIWDLSSHRFLGSSRNVALGVLMGDFQAGAIREELFQLFRKRGLESLACSPPISGSLYVAGATMAPALAERIKSRLLAISQLGLAPALLKPIRNELTDLVPVQDMDYENLKAIFTALEKSEMSGAP